MSDLISRQAAVEVLEAKKDKSAKGDMGCFYNTIIQNDIDALKGLPSAQPDAIPLEWIAKHLEWLDNCDNDFAQLAKVAIRAMVEIWKKEKT